LSTINLKCPPIMICCEPRGWCPRIIGEKA
jgi:hypothetical protein